MTLQDLLIQAKALSYHVAQPVYRHAAAKYARTFEIEIDCGTYAVEWMDCSVRALIGLMKSVDLMDDPQAILKTGAAIAAAVDAIRANLPKPQPRRYWTEGANA